jgi:ABC-type sugar transport system ATPase subunit
MLLLDEPLTNLDAALRDAMRRKLQQSLGITTVYVTHDQAETLSLSETITVTRAQSMRRVVVPLIMPSVVSLFVWVLVDSFRQFSAAVVLRSGNNDGLSIVLYSFWDDGKPDAAAAIAVTKRVALGVVVVVSHRYAALGARAK